MKVHTPDGDIELRDPLPERLVRLRGLLPLGAIRYSQPINGARYGIVMKCGQAEAHAIKQQPMEQSPEIAEGQFMANRVLIALSLHAYLRGGFAGVLILAPYMRHKPAGVEAGIAFFFGPSPSGREATEYPFSASFDTAFGHGATTMLKHAVRSIQSASGRSNIALQECIGLDVRPRSALENIELAWLVHARDVYCLKTKLNEKDPIWAALRSTGISEVFHMPSIPAEIRESDLPLAKPEIQ